MNVSSRCWSTILANECVFSHIEQQKVLCIAERCENYSHIGESLRLSILDHNTENKTKGTFRQVPTRQIRLSFVKCAYSDLRDIFFHNFRGLKWIPQ